MMEINKFLILTKYLLLGGSYGSGRKKLSRFSKNFVSRMILTFILFVIFAGFVGLIDVSIYFGVKILHMEYLFLQINYSAITLIILVFGIFSTMGVFYFSNDINFLMPMPFKPETIVASKFTVSLIREYFITAAILVPCTLIYGIGSSCGALFYIYSILFIIFQPILPLAIALLISILIMPFINKSKKKDLFKTLGGIFALLFAVGINVATRMMGNASNLQLLQNAKKANSVMVNMFPLGSLASTALVNLNLVYVLIFVLINVLSFVIIIFLGKYLYFKGVQGLSESSSKRKKIDSRKMNKETQKKSILFSYTIKEMKILFRTPAYFVNCVMSSFILPIILLIPVFFSNSNEHGLKDALSYVSTSQNFRIIIASAIVFGLIMGAMNAVTSTSISREGSNFFVMKYIPVSYSNQITAKITSGILIGAMGIVIIDIIAFFVIGFPAYVGIYIFVAGVLGNIFTSLIGMYVDLSMPKLEWDTEQRAVKSNFNSLIAFLVSIVPSAIIIIMCIFVRVNSNVFFIISVIIFVVLDYIVYKFVCSSGEKKLNNYES
ncbi:putative ABC transporter permease subunit [Clostridium felsineum]|uniref:Uncharacterized protein n=1 Tax=Clostridium felsineum TaxID=36839 RepID=A0A1S8LPF6_9CLOT|nr:hypothetical protein [Clostridium felsineum]URZ04809.1 hypothetical protein CLROS_001240 [Clostridium felsineum]URZ09850.1 hypothetical protein CROST_005490 [Clostridium felsineum]